MDTIKRKCTVVMLPTIEKTNILRNTYCLNEAHGNPLRYEDIDHATERGFEHNHLYIISDEKIKDGDIVFHSMGYVSKVLGFNMDAIRLEDAQRWTKDCKKIIASTDSKLNLPAPSKSFIEKYCKQGGIDQIMVDYSKPLIHKGEVINNSYPNDFTYYAPVIKWEIGKQKIVISKVKDSWSKDEVETIVRMAMQSKGFTPEYEVQEFCKNNLK